MMYDEIEVTRQPGEDASAAAKRAADAAGTKICGNIRWYGDKDHREVPTEDRRGITILEPDRTT